LPHLGARLHYGTRRVSPEWPGFQDKQEATGMGSGMKWTLGSAVVLALALPAGAQAATKSVNMGTNRAQQKVLQRNGADVNAFFPSNVAVHVGDSVRFVPTSFHSVHFFGRSGKLTPIFTPGAAIAGQLDAAGAPFWFNGLPNFVTNGALFAPPGKFGKTLVSNGTQEIESGLPTAPNSKPMTVRFTKAGLRTYYCDLHPGMKGTVRVLPASRPAPSTRADANRVKAQAKKAVAESNKFRSLKPPANTVYVGAAGKGGTEFFGFAPGKLTVPVGTTVRFIVPGGSFETHTASTGPGNPESQPKSYLGAIANGQDDPRGAYPSDPPPAGPAALTPLLHGNGFWSSGAMDVNANTPLPNSNSVTFAQAGTYEFYCLIHPFMHGTITAQ
jgi:plastocyanin